MRDFGKQINIIGNLLLGIFFLGLFLLPATAKAAEPSVLLREYLFPIQYSGDINKNDVIGLRIYSNLDNKEPLTWYLSNVTNPKASLPKITADGYQAVRDDRTVYIQASNLDLTGTPTFYTNIYVLAYNQNATADTLNIYNQMLSNLKFNKNIMDLYCLPAQYEAVKDRLRRDTLRKADLYKMKVILSGAPNINLQAGTYVPGMSLSTWPSWQATLDQQLGTALPIDPLNIMADRLIGCTSNADCASLQCSGGYCSACLPDWDPRTCWNERELDYQEVDGFVYKYQTAGNVLTIRYEWPQLVFPESAGGECFLGCLYENAYYLQGACLPDNRYCNAGDWETNECGDGTVRCSEVCEGANCADNCLTCNDHYHAVGSICEEDRMTVSQLTQHLSTAEEIRWTGSGWSDPYATACKANAILSTAGVCNCKTNYHEEWSETEYVCRPDSRWFGCEPKPATGAVWNTVEGYSQTWDGEKWVPADSIPTAYNPTPSTNTCRFKCTQYFTWTYNDETEEYECKGDSRPADCEPIPVDHAVWNNGLVDGKFTQVWNGTIWAPETVSTEYNELAGDNTCNFKCDTGYHWEVSACVADSREYTCPDKPATGTAWNNVGSYTQNWNTSSSVWEPEDAVTEYNATATTTACHYKCDGTYVWDGTECVLCGNGLVDTADGEECDDGDLDDTDYCKSDCTYTIQTEVSVDTSSLIVTGSETSSGINFDNDNLINNSNEAGGSYLKVSAISPTPYIWVSISSHDLIAKIRTFDGKKVTQNGIDINVDEFRGQLIGKYSTGGNDPSRTAVNVETGDVWVANRSDNRVTKLNIEGEIKKTCITGNNPRGLAIEQNGDVWVANSGTPYSIVKISGDDDTCPATFTESINKVSTGISYPYGLAIDSNNSVWVVNQGNNKIGRINTTTITQNQTYDSANPYGLAVDRDDKVWVGRTIGGGYKIDTAISPYISVVSVGQSGTAYGTTGVTVDIFNQVWFSAYWNGIIFKLNRANPNYSESFVATSNPHGIAGDYGDVDSSTNVPIGKIWSIGAYNGEVRVFNAATGAELGRYCAYGDDNKINCISGENCDPTNNPLVKKVASCPVATTYTYSDMTGLNRAMVIRTGTYWVVLDSGINHLGQHWGSVAWDQADISDTNKQKVEVFLRVNDYTTALKTTEYIKSAAWNDLSLAARPGGRYLEIKVVISSRIKDETPVVSNLRIVE